MGNIAEIEQDLEQARENLHRTLDELNRKAAVTGAELFLPEQQVRRYPISALCAALALGLAAGGSPTPAMLLAMLAVGSALTAPNSDDSNHGGSDNGSR